VAVEALQGISSLEACSCMVSLQVLWKPHRRFYQKRRSCGYGLSFTQALPAGRLWNCRVVKFTAADVQELPQDFQTLS
jgi:hypothetical protein